MYTLNNDGRMRVDDFQQAPAFSSFLPGISGVFGIPLWVFYVNRGQGICSFGLDNKDGAIMEFQPAVKSYHDVHTLGFRTFIKVTRGVGFQGGMNLEAFAESKNSSMVIGLNDLELVQHHNPLEIRVVYSTLFEQPVSGLIRSLTIKNASENPLSFDLLDGIPRVVPFGSSDEALKDMANTLTGWMLAEDIQGKGLYARLSSSTEDRTHVVEQHQGNYFFSFVDLPVAEGGRLSSNQAVGEVEAALERVLPCIVDPEPVFSQDTGFRVPEGFYSRTLRDLLACPEVRVGRFPCGFSAGSFDLAGGEAVTIHTLVGSADRPERIAQLLPKIMAPGFIQENRQQGRALIDQLVKPMTAKTADPTFDQYLKQTHLDNILRGGYPWQLTPGKTVLSEAQGNLEAQKVGVGRVPEAQGKRDAWMKHADREAPRAPVYREGQTYYLFSRKHGDLERDYNAFNLLPEYYSRGYGNYRDVNQNRRSDVLFHPQVHHSIIREFMTLFQPDGYNPLVVRGRVFRLPKEKRQDVLQDLGVGERNQSAEGETEPLAQAQQVLEQIVSRDFTPGELAWQLEIVEGAKAGTKSGGQSYRAGTNQSYRAGTSHNQIQERLSGIMEASEPVYTSDHGEGFWIDHWTYTLDLIDAYAAVYPDRMGDLMFAQSEYGYTSPGARVLPRSRRYSLVNGRVLQLHGTEHGETPGENRLLTNSQGGIVTSTLFEKLLLILGVKLTTLDAQGIGVEMEAGKPGWYDALNGLPALFGSSTSETAELFRLTQMLIQALEDAGQDTPQITLPDGAADLWQHTTEALRMLKAGSLTRFAYWDRVNTLREEYRAQVYEHFGEILVQVDSKAVKNWLRAAETELRGALERARAQRADGLMPTYFIGEATQWSSAQDQHGESYIKVEELTYTPMPLFLEGIVKQAKTSGDPQAVAEILKKIKLTGLYDKPLGMYKVNESLADQPNQIGRARAFTPGWLENESVWLHMEYKFLLELLKAGLGREFWQEARSALVPFLNPVVYGRSVTENSSFIVSSVHPDLRYHGRGFVARLSGSTAEFLDMWQTALWGTQPFHVADGALCLEFLPQLPSWLFSPEGVLEAHFLGSIRVKIIIKPGSDLLDGQAPKRYHLHYQDGSTESMPGPRLVGPKALDIRTKRVAAMEIVFEGVDK